MSNVVVTGITTGIQPNAPVSALPQRLEWHQFVQNMDFVTLYVEALQAFMNLDQSETVAYFQIGGSSLIFSHLINRYSWLALHSMEQC